MGFIIIQKEDLAAIKIKNCLVAVKANLSGGLTKMIIKVVTFITSTIEIIKELIIFIKYKASELEVFRVTITKKIGKSVKVIRQQQ